MNIKETVKGNIQITMSEEETWAIFSLLTHMDYVDYLEYVDEEEADHLCSVWACLDSHRELFYTNENS